jgi:hypothetical protein
MKYEYTTTPQVFPLHNPQMNLGVGRCAFFRRNPNQGFPDLSTHRDEIHRERLQRSYLRRACCQGFHFVVALRRSDSAHLHSGYILVAVGEPIRRIAHNPQFATSHSTNAPRSGANHIPSGTYRSVEMTSIQHKQHPVRDASLTGCPPHPQPLFKRRGGLGRAVLQESVARNIKGYVDVHESVIRNIKGSALAKNTAASPLAFWRGAGCEVNFIFL